MPSPVTMTNISSIKRHPSIQLPSSSSSSPHNHGEGVKEFVVGAILPFTGSLSSIGKPIKVALEKAEYDVNKHFQDHQFTIPF